jgi:Ni,Fe-hydrogenase maturation factor
MRDISFTTHAISPASVLDVYQTMKKTIPPPCFLLAIGAESFELGDGLSDNAKNNFAHATKLINDLLNNLTIGYWQMQCR